MTDDQTIQNIVINFDSSRAEDGAKRVNRAQDSIADSAKEAGAVSSGALDKITAAALKAAEQLKLIDVGMQNSANSAERYAQRIQSAMDSFAARSAARARGGSSDGNPRQPNAAQLAQYEQQLRDQMDAEYRRMASAQDAAVREDQRRAANSPQAKQAASIQQAQAGVSNLIKKSQDSELSGAARIEQQRKDAIASFGKTDELVKQINGHYDDLLKKSADGAFAQNVRNFIQNPLGAAAKASESFAASYGVVGTVIAAAAVGLALGAKAAFNLSQETGAAARNFENVAAKTGLTTAEVQELSGVAAIAGINFGAFTTSMRTLSKAFTENSDDGIKAKNTLRQLGIDGGSAIAGVRPLGQLLPEIFQKLQSVNSAFERDRILIQLFGRQGLEFAPLIGHLDQFIQAVRESGVVMDDSFNRKASEYQRQLDEIGLRWKAVKQAVAEPIVATFSYIIRKSDNTDGDIGLLNAGAFTKRAEAMANAETLKELNKTAGQAFINQQKDIDRANETLIAGIEKSAGVGEAEIQRLQSQLKALESDIQGAEIRVKSAKLDGTTGSADRQKAIHDLSDLAARKAGMEKELDLAQLLAQEPRRQANAARQAQSAFEAAQSAEIDGVGKILIERNKLVESLTTEIGKRGQVIHLSLDQATQDKINAEAQLRIATEQRREQEQIRKLVQENLDLQTAGAKAAVTQEFELDSKHLDLIAAAEVQSRAQVEAQRLALHKQEISDELALELNQIERRKRQEQTAAQEQFSRNTTGVTGDALEKEQRLLADRTQAIQQKADQQTSAAQAAARTQRQQLDLDAKQQSIEIEKAVQDQIRKLTQETATLGLDARREALDAEKTAALDNLDLIAAKDIEGRKRIERERLAIELDYLTQTQNIDQQAIAAQRAESIRATADEGNKRKETAEEIASEIATVNKKYDSEVLNSAQKTGDAIASARLKASISAQKAELDADRQTFDQIKGMAGNLFDEIFSSDKGHHNFADFLAKTFRNAFQSAFKDAFSSVAAAIGTQAITGDRVTLKRGGGILGGLGLPTVPEFDLSRLKIQQAGSIGDVRLDSDGNIPVVIANLPTGSDVSAPHAAAAGLLNRAATSIVQLVTGPFTGPRGTSSSSVSFPGASALPGGGGGFSLPRPLGGAAAALNTALIAGLLLTGNPAAAAGHPGESVSSRVLSYSADAADLASATSGGPFFGQPGGPSAAGYGIPSTGVGSGSSTGGSYSNGNPGFDLGGGIFGDLGSILGAPGGTAPFNPSAAAGGSGSRTGSAGGGILGSILGGGSKRGGLFSLSSIGFGADGLYGAGDIGTGIIGGAKAIAGSQLGGTIGAGLLLGSISSKPSALSGAQGAAGGVLLGSRYAGQLGLSSTGGAIAGLGAGLAIDGIHRGGALGIGEDSAGGALIGSQYGGPIGAALGAAVGAIAGTARLFIKGDVQQMQDKVKAQYGLNISKQMAQQLVDLAKSSFGGQFNLTLQSPQAQNLLSLYAQSTGQNFGLINKARPAYLVNSGGNLYQAASYENGSSIGFQSSLAPYLSNFDKVIGPTQYGKTGTLGVQQPLNVSVSLDGKSSAQFLQGQTISTIQTNPRIVSDASQDSYLGSYNRRALAGLLTQPGTVLS